MTWLDRRIVRAFGLALVLAIVAPAVTGCNALTPWHILNAHNTVPNTPVATPAAGPTALEIPTSVQVGCDETTSSSYAGVSDCTSEVMYAGDVMAFYVNDLTPDVAAWLCDHGFRGEWLFSRGTGSTTLSLCRLVRSQTWTSGSLETGYNNPESLGPVTVTWRLTGPGGFSIQSSSSFTVVQTQYAGQSPP